MNYGLLFRTVSHLKFKQVFYQVRNRLIKPAYSSLEAPGKPEALFRTAPIPKSKCLENGQFCFLNLVHAFAGWSFADNGMLWAYNQNYFDWINQDGFSEDDGCVWIDRFICDLPGNKVGLDPYPIALRSINWIKFFCRYPGLATKPRLDSLYSQLRLLEKKTEYHLLGNHLLEDAFAMYIGAAYFDDGRLLRKATKLLLQQLKEQVLPDGAHYEQSPMYHCILLDRLLDCICIRSSQELEGYASRMLGHLESIVWDDGSIPLFNDSAYGIAPQASQLFEYSKRLGLSWKAIPLKECGYRKLKDSGIEVILDVGNITASYQPGHTHADAFSYEIRIDGKPFIVDTGISSYNKTPRRQAERSTTAHNTVSVNGANSSEVWGGFRVGRRCHIRIIDDSSVIRAVHNGFAQPCERTFSLENGVLSICDKYEGEAVSYIHLAEGADEKRIHFEEGADKIETAHWDYSTDYNRFHDGRVLAIGFNGNLKYSIR